MYERRPSTSSTSPNTDMITPINEKMDSTLDLSFSPSISRYGRSHKLKIQDDYVSTDKKVSAYLKLSPGNQMQYFSAHKEVKKKCSPKKLDAKEQEGTPRRGRPPKTPPKDGSANEGKLKMVVKVEPQDPSSPVDGCEWMVGDLAWARVGGHPFWPCIIALDPIQKIFTKTVRKGRTMVSQRMVHVQFFGDNGRRSWLNTSAIMSYNGRDAFIQLGDTILAGMRKKEPKQTSAFVIKPAVVQVWEKAVQEAEDLVNASRDERIAFFTRNFPPSPPLQLTKEDLIEMVLDHPNSPAKKRGRKRKAEQNLSQEESKIKQIKLEDKKEEIEPAKLPASKPAKEESPLLTSTPRTIADRKKRQALLMQLARSNQSTPDTITPSVPPTVSHKTEVEASAKQTPLKRLGAVESSELVDKKKPKKKYSKKNLAADFQMFCSKQFDRVSDDHPELNEKEINKYLQKRWNEMDETAKARYRSRLTGQEKEENELAEEMLTEDAEACIEEVEEEIRSSKSNSPVPLAPTQKSTSTKRSNCKYLFSGAKAEKVCQICEKNGDTVRCRGPCQGYYHPICITNPPTPQQILPITPGKKRRGRPKKSFDNSFTSLNESLSDEHIENSNTSLQEDNSEKELISKESEIKEESEPIGFAEKINGSSNVEVVEPDMKLSTKVRKSSKDSESGEENEGFRCKDCTEGRSQPCFVCHEGIGEAKLYRCITAYCGKVYHEECLKPWPQSSWRSNGNGKGCDRGVMTCPQHTCHTCASDNPGVIKARYSNDKLVRCVRCPTTYHYGNYCLPAGSEILTNTQIICPQHYQPPKKGLIHHVNAAWCFICASGGSLICCDLCPTSFHADCLKITLPADGSYVCEDCLTGRFPLYGEIVWVKLGTYRWWPAEILYPALIPDNILNLPHVRGEFAVRFFGSHDHYWVNRGRVFLYQDGDTAGKGNYKKSSVDHMFERAVREASEAQRKYLEEKTTREAETRPGMKPPNYVKLKANRPVGNVRTMEMNVSNLTPCECDPKSEAPCAPESDCLNRILMVECNPIVCPAGEKCCNQLFEKRQYPPLQPYQTQARGWGLKTLVPLKKGDFVIEYVGEMIDEEEYKRRLSHMHENNEENYYFLTIDKDRMLDAGPKGNVARFMNHSCQPNCETQKWTVNGDTRVGLFALCDVPANTELVFNYNLESIGSDKKPCMCGAPNCSGFIGVKANKNQDKEESKEKKVVKKKKTTAVSKAHDEDCFMCGEDGELLLCDGKHCTKGYHLNCLGKKQRPQGYWLCPWHQCNICNKGRVRRCTFCVNSFCQEHSENNIRLDSIRGLVCTKHDQVDNDDSAVKKPLFIDLPRKDDIANSEAIPMEVDIDSSEDSTTASNHSTIGPSTKADPTNNNVIKSDSVPERRLRRSRSYSGGKPNSGIFVNGAVDCLTKRISRHSSVDEKLIVSSEKIEQHSRKLGPKDEIDEKSKVRNDVYELLNQVIYSLPLKETVSENINDCKDYSVIKEQEHVNQSSETTMTKVYNHNTEINVFDSDISEKNEEKEQLSGIITSTVEDTNIIASLQNEKLKSPDFSECTQMPCNNSDLNCFLDKKPKTECELVRSNDHKEITEINAVDQNTEKEDMIQPRNHVIDKENFNVFGKEITNTNEDKELIENKCSDVILPYLSIDTDTDEHKTMDENNGKAAVLDILEKTISEQVSNHSQDPVNNFQERNIESTAESVIEKTSDETVQNDNKTSILPVDEHVDDFELSYSECSNDKLYKNVTNSESSIEMKLTGCTSNESERRKDIEEINSKSDLASCIEQSNPMEVA